MSTWVDRGRKGSLIVHVFSILNKEWYIFRFCEYLKLQSLRQKLQEKAYKDPSPLCLPRSTLKSFT